MNRASSFSYAKALSRSLWNFLKNKSSPSAKEYLKKLVRAEMVAIAVSVPHFAQHDTPSLYEFGLFIGAYVCWFEEVIAEMGEVPQSLKDDIDVVVKLEIVDANYSLSVSLDSKQKFSWYVPGLQESCISEKSGPILTIPRRCKRDPTLPVNCKQKEVTVIP